MPRFVALALALSIVARPSAARVDASIDSRALRDAGALLDVPSDDAAWYAAASWDENHYARALGTSTGRATTVTTTRGTARGASRSARGVRRRERDDADARRGRVAAARRRGAKTRDAARNAATDAVRPSTPNGTSRGERRRRWESQRARDWRSRAREGISGGRFTLDARTGERSFDDAAFKGCEAREGGAVFVASDASAGKRGVSERDVLNRAGRRRRMGEGGGRSSRRRGRRTWRLNRARSRGTSRMGWGGGCTPTVGTS